MKTAIRLYFQAAEAIIPTLLVVAVVVCSIINATTMGLWQGALTCAIGLVATGVYYIGIRTWNEQEYALAPSILCGSSLSGAVIVIAGYIANFTDHAEFSDFALGIGIVVTLAPICLAAFVGLLIFMKNSIKLMIETP